MELQEVKRLLLGKGDTQQRRDSLRSGQNFLLAIHLTEYIHDQKLNIQNPNNPINKRASKMNN